MGTDEIYRVNSHVVFRETNRSLIMLFDRKQGTMYECNDTASSVLKLIDGKRSISAIASLLAEEYEAEPEEIRRDVEEVIRRFEKVAVLLPADAADSNGVSDGAA